MRRRNRRRFRWRTWLIASALCAVTVNCPPAAYQKLPQERVRDMAARQGVYQIGSFDDLRQLSKEVSLCEGAFEVDVQLMCDIRAEGLFVPIGDALHRFEGTFDGGSHVIEGLKTDGKGEFQGLFGYVGNGGVVKNLTVRNAHIDGMRYTGGIAAYSSGRIENCRVEQSGIIGRSPLEYGTATGGIVGLSCGEVTRCVSRNVTVAGGCHTGGIAGSQHAQMLSLCISHGRVLGFHEGYSHTGGIAGSIQTGAQAKGCISLCSVWSVGQWTGGAVGSVQSGKLLGCMAIGKVEGQSAGGVSGYAARQAQLIRCVHIGTLPVGVGEGKQSGVQVFRADERRLERNKMWLMTILRDAGFFDAADCGADFS